MHSKTEDSGGDSVEPGWPTFMRSLKVASMVVPSSRRIVYLEDEADGVSVGEAKDSTRLEKTIGTVG